MKKHTPEKRKAGAAQLRPIPGQKPAKRRQVWRPGDRVEAKTFNGWAFATVVQANADGTCELAFDKGTRGRSWKQKNVRNSMKKDLRPDLAAEKGTKPHKTPPRAAKGADEAQMSKMLLTRMTTRDFRTMRSQVTKQLTGASPVKSNGRNEGGADLVFLHFNDAYHETHKVTGGAARFLTCLKDLRRKYPQSLTVFSGDAFSPSVTSAMVKGWNMLPILNAMQIDVATLGNHELDHGHSNFNKLRAKSNFPWICSNMRQKRNGRPLGYCEKYFTTEKAGINVGFLGMGEKEWLDCLNDRAKPPGGIEYVDYVKEGNSLVNEMRQQDKVDFIVSLSHVRWSSDVEIVKGVPGIDIVLGGHDHFYRLGKLGSVPMVNSGTDFEQLTVVELFKKGNPNAPPASKEVRPDDPEAVVASDDWTYRLRRVDITEEEYEDDPVLAGEIRDMGETVNKKLDHQVGVSVYDIDATTQLARTGQSPAGSWMSDIIRGAYKCDFALVHGGSVRSNAVYKAGPLTLRDVRNIFPFADMIGVVEVTGQMMWDALENGVRHFPEPGDGRFPQISGLRFVFDGEAPVGKRIVSVDTGDKNVGWVPLDLAKKYSMGTLSFICTGNNETGLVDKGLGGGYTMFRGSRVIRDEENGHVSFQLVLDHMHMVRVANRFTRFDKKLRSKQIVRDAVSKFWGLIAKDDQQRQIAKAKQAIIPIFGLPNGDGRIQVLREGKPVQADLEAQRYFLARQQLSG